MSQTSGSVLQPAFRLRTSLHMEKGLLMAGNELSSDKDTIRYAVKVHAQYFV